MTDPVNEALALWGLSDAPYRFVAGRENRVYRVDTAAGPFALRLKRPGYRSPGELLSELQWMAAMGLAGLRVPRPRPALSGALLEQVGGHYVDMVSWLGGQPLGQSRAPLTLPDAPATFYQLGADMAHLHEACDSWQPPASFVRCHWDAEGLLGDTPLWGAFWDNPTLDADTRGLLERFRHVARDVLDRLGPGLDFGLIHGDLVRENVMISDGALAMIDFDDGGFGYRLFDVATALLKNRAEPNYDALKAALIAGYHSRRPLDMRHLDLFLALRAVTYVGWIVPRITEDGAVLRNARFQKDARTLCAAFLDQPQLVS